MSPLSFAARVAARSASPCASPSANAAFTPLLNPVSQAVRAVVLSLVFAAAASLSPDGLAAGPQPLESAATQPYNLPAGPLGRSLAGVAVQNGVALSFDPSLTEGLTSPAVTGQYTAREVFNRLLAGSGLEIVPRTDNSHTLRKLTTPEPGPDSGTQAAAGEALLPIITVRPGSPPESPTGPVSGYVAKRSATATKTDTPILETSQSISVVTRDELDARGVTSGIEALRYVPGVMTSAFGQDDRGWESFSIRGFSSSYDANYLDGLRQVGSGFVVPQNEPYGLERIEVLRGPSTTMYGQGDAGGVINRVSKRPSAEARREVEVQLGNYRRQQLAANVGGAVDGEGRFSYRIVGLALGNDPQIDYPGYDERRTRRVYLAPSFAWRPSADTSLVLLTDYLEVHATNNGTEYVDGAGRRSGVLGYEPSYDFHDQRQWSVGYQFEHRFNPTWTVRQNLRTSRGDIGLRAVLGYNGTDVAGILDRMSLRFSETLRYTTLDNQAQARFAWGGAEHTALIGVDWMRFKLDSQRYMGTAPSLNLAAPVYGLPIDEPQTEFQGSRDAQRQLGFYVQDQVKLGAWRLNAGLRHDTARTDNDNHLGASSTSVRDSATTGRLGASLVLSSGWVPYVSYAESFLPEAGQDFFGNRFKPTRGRQHEAGVKYQPVNGTGLLTLAVFDLTKTNLQTADPDPAHVDYTIQTGKVRTRGFEFEAKQELLRGLVLSAQYTFLDTKVTEANDASLGQRTPQVPLHMASAWLDHKVRSEQWRGLSVGAGVRHVSSRYANPQNTFSTPAYTLVDAMLGQDLGAWRFALHVNNLTDKEYAGDGNGYYPGARRTGTLTGRYVF